MASLKALAASLFGLGYKENRVVYGANLLPSPPELPEKEGCAVSGGLVGVGALHMISVSCHLVFNEFLAFSAIYE